MFNGKIHYKWSFSIATLNYQRVRVDGQKDHRGALQGGYRRMGQAWPLPYLYIPNKKLWSIVFFGPWFLSSVPLKLPFGYGSIPIDTNFWGMNIRWPAILMFTRYQGFDPSPCGSTISPFLGQALLGARKFVLGLAFSQRGGSFIFERPGGWCRVIFPHLPGEGC